eukprot:UN03282
MRYPNYKINYELRQNINMLLKYAQPVVDEDKFNYQILLFLHRNLSGETCDFDDGSDLLTESVYHTIAPDDPIPSTPQYVENRPDVCSLSFLSYLYPYLQIVPQFVLKSIMAQSSQDIPTEHHIVADLLYYI